MSALPAIIALAFARPAEPSESAAGIMAKVAENQQRAVEMRRVVRLPPERAGEAQTRKRETGARGGSRPHHHPDRRLVLRRSWTGSRQVREGRQYIEYSKPGYTYKGTDIDGELASDLADDLTAEKDSRDGIANDLFPAYPGAPEAVHVHAGRPGGVQRPRRVPGNL